MTKLTKITNSLFIITLICCATITVFMPYFYSKKIAIAKKYARGRFVCTLDENGQHIASLYKLNGNNKPKLISKKENNSCVFTTPKLNVGFFVFAIGGGGGATPYEDGKPGEVISKHKNITNPVIIIKVGQGGNGTFLNKEGILNDAQNGEATTIKALNITAKGGSKSTRMTPLGNSVKNTDYYIPELYHYLYDIPKNTKYGAGGKQDKLKNNSSVQAQNGDAGAVIIQW